MLLTTLLFTLLLSSCCWASKILLMFPIPSRSHSILGEGYVKHLAEAGHEITYITPFSMRDPPPGVRQIDISQNKKYMPIDIIFDTTSVMNDEMDLQNAKNMMEVGVIFANGTLHIEGVQKLLDDPQETFDAVIVEWLYTEMFSGLATVFNCPLIWSSSMDAHSMILSLVDEYLNPAYTTHHLSRDYGLGFWQRVHQLWLVFQVRMHKWKMQNYENEMFAAMYGNVLVKRGLRLPSYDEVRYNGSLILGNSYISVGEAINLPQSYKSIGGYHIPKTIEPLSEDLQTILDNAHGVIYFSMGSMLKSSRIPEHLKTDIVNIFRSLKQTVIWKFEEILPNLPENVHILPWVPQTSVLAHPNCKLFITHGGLLSKIEAIHFGVPIIGIPFYGDQFLNINRAEARGFGKRVDLNVDGVSKLDAAIKEMLSNPSYRNRVKEYSFIHHHRPTPPEKELVHWVEHVIATRGAPHLRTPALLTPWYQKYYLDLAAVVLLVYWVMVQLYRHKRPGRKHSKKKYS